MTDNLLDGALGFEIVQGLAGERAVDLQAVDEDGDGDQAVGLDILVETLLEGLVEDDGVDGLVLDCSRKSTSALRSARVWCSCDAIAWWMDVCAFRRIFQGRRRRARMEGDDGGNRVPLPLDHFFFCFPAGGYCIVSTYGIALHPSAAGTYHDCCLSVKRCSRR